MPLNENNWGNIQQLWGMPLVDNVYVPHQVIDPAQQGQAQQALIQGWAEVAAPLNDAEEAMVQKVQAKGKQLPGTQPGKWYVNAAMKDRSVSQLSDEYLDLEAQLGGLTTSIRQEQAELANVLEDIAKKVEVVRDIGSLVQSRIASLLQVAIQLETMKQSLRLPSQAESAQAPSAEQPAHPQAGPFAGVLKGQSGLEF